MHTIFQRFVDDHLALSQEHISRASDSHNYLRDALKNKQASDRAFPWMVEGDFLSGSYIRGTKIHPLDDVDVVMVLDGTGLYANKGGTLLNASIRGSGGHGSPVHSFIEGGNLDSRRVIDVFARALHETYPSSTVSKAGQAVNVRFTYGMGIDVVPAFHIVPNGGDGLVEHYFIPQGGNSQWWISTNPQIDRRIGDWHDNAKGNRLKPVIRLVKSWNQLRNNGRLRSYHLEVLCWTAFQNTAITDYSTALRYFFSVAGGLIATTCPDPTRLGDPIDRYLSVADRQASIEAANNANALINPPRLGFAVPTVPSLTQWRSLFGDRLGA